MSKTHPPYAPKYRRQIVELTGASRTPGELAREFECSASAIRKLARQADRDEGRREDGFSTEEREHLRWLRRENGQLRTRKRVARLMCESSVAGVSRRRCTRTTRSNSDGRTAPDRRNPALGCLSPNDLGRRAAQVARRSLISYQAHPLPDRTGGTNPRLHRGAENGDPAAWKRRVPAFRTGFRTVRES